MIRSLGKRMSPSLFISCLALFIALGSVGYSATGGTFRLGEANTAGKTTAVKSGTNAGATFKAENTGTRPAASFVTKSGVAPFTVNRTAKVAKLNADQIDGLDSLAFLQVSTVFGGDVAGPFGDLQLGNGVVDSATVLDETLTASDIAASAVSQSEIATDGVGALEVQNDSIDFGEIVDFGLTNQDIGVLYAEVQANGTLDNSSGANNGNPVTVTKLPATTGNYEVDFGLGIQSCTAVATIGPSGGGSIAGEVNVADRGGNNEAVFVDTNNSAGTATDLPFRLIVVC